MKTKTTEIKAFNNNTLYYVFHRFRGFWVVTHASNFARASDSFDNYSEQKWKTIKQLKLLLASDGLGFESNKSNSLIKTSNRDRARVYSQSRKSYKNRKLAVWMTPDDFKNLSRLKKKCFELGFIPKATNELLIRFLLNKDV